MRSEQLRINYLRVEKFLNRLRAGAPLIDRAPLAGRFYRSSEPVSFADRLKGNYRQIESGQIWGGAWDSAWFCLTGSIPPGWSGGAVVARLNFGGESCVFDDNGCPLQGLSSGSVFDLDIRYSKDIYFLPAGTAERGRVELWVEAAANALFGVNQQYDPPPGDPRRHGTYEGRVNAMELALFDMQVWRLMIDVTVLFDLLAALCRGGSGGVETDWRSSVKILPQITPRARRILFLLNRAIDAYGDDSRNAAKARDVLAELFKSPAHASDAVAVSVGHAHIDTGWLWPVCETIRKCGRTFASQVSLIERYPGYVFGASQPQHYLFVKQHYPALYEKIRRHVRSGRWEPQGGMWVEADCSITGGESLVRQFLHGKNFFRDEFGCDVRNLWLPDVFGFSAALPQIMKKAGVEFMLTQKMSWSQFTEFPHNTFRWRGIDGSEVIAHFPPEDNYNSPMLPQSQIGAQNSFKEGHLLEEFLCLYGVGNGGGGPKEEHVERALRMQNLEGCPKVKLARSDEFFGKLKDRAAELQVWDGELYLELHRATLTTQARTKKANRTLERKLREVEFVYSALPPEHYPGDELDKLWKTLLINQFHDILPGSSIRMVYDVTEAELADAAAACDRLIAEAATRLNGDADSLTLVNTLAVRFQGPVTLPQSWKGEAPLDTEGRPLPAQTDHEGTVVMADIPPCSALTVKKSGNTAKTASNGSRSVLENDFIRYEFGKNGTLRSAFDREMKREMLPAGKSGNVLSLYVDRPAKNDAWDIDIHYEDEQVSTAESIEVTPLGSGPVRQGIRFKLKIGGSTLLQNVYLYPGGKRLEFHTQVEWTERHRMLRVAFPTVVPAHEALCDIQFGFIRRPTHRNSARDLARFEVCAHKYADVSTEDFGAALLNDCKYGYKIYDGVLDLNLLRSPSYPDPDADRGSHTFRYALLPHCGSLTGSDTIEEALRFNFPPAALESVDHGQFVSPIAIDGRGVSLAALKKAEKEDCTIVRLAENRGRFSTCRLTLARDGQLIPCNLMEWNEEPPLKGTSHELHFTPFEIKTFKIR